MSTTKDYDSTPELRALAERVAEVVNAKHPHSAIRTEAYELYPILNVVMDVLKENPS